MELANPRVSPMNYTFERDRIDAEVAKGDSSLVMRDRWTQKSGSLFREREPGKEVQPIMVFSHRADAERINNVIERNPVMPLQVLCTPFTCHSVVVSFLTSTINKNSLGLALTTQSTANFAAQCSLTVS